MKNLPILIIVGVIVICGAFLFISQSKATQIVHDLFSDEASTAMLRLALLSDSEQLAVTGLLLARFEDLYSEYTNLRQRVQSLERTKTKGKRFDKVQTELWQKELECTGILAIIKNNIKTPQRIEYIERFIGLLSDNKYRSLAADIIKQLPQKQTAVHIYEAYKNGPIRAREALYATNDPHEKIRILKRYADREKFDVISMVRNIRSSSHYFTLQTLPYCTDYEKRELFAALHKIPFSEIGPDEGTLPALAYTASREEIPRILAFIEKAMDAKEEHYSDDIMRTMAILGEKAAVLSAKFHSKMQEILACESWNIHSVQLAMAFLYLAPDNPHAIEVVAGVKSPELSDDIQQTFLQIVPKEKLLPILEAQFSQRKILPNQIFKDFMIEKDSQVLFAHFMANIRIPHHQQPYILHDSLWDISRFDNKSSEVVQKFVEILQNDEYQVQDKRTVVYILGKKFVNEASIAIPVIKILMEKYRGDKKLLMEEFCSYALRNIVVNQ